MATQDQILYALAKQISDMRRGCPIATNYDGIELDAGQAEQVAELLDRMMHRASHALNASQTPTDGQPTMRSATARDQSTLKAKFQMLTIEQQEFVSDFVSKLLRDQAAAIESADVDGAESESRR